MRIDLNNLLLNSVEREDQTRKAASNAAPNAPREEDKASPSLDTRSASSLQAQAMAAPAVRQDRVDALRHAIQNGEYKVEADKVAQAILEQNKF